MEDHRWKLEIVRTIATVNGRLDEIEALARYLELADSEWLDRWQPIHDRLTCKPDTFDRSDLAFMLSESAKLLDELGGMRARHESEMAKATRMVEYAQKPAKARVKHPPGRDRRKYR